MRRSAAPRRIVAAGWGLPVAVAIVALAIAVYAGWSAKALDTGPGSVQLGRGLFTLIAVAGIALLLGAAELAAARGLRGVARAIVLSVVAFVLGYLAAYAVAPEAAAADPTRFVHQVVDAAQAAVTSTR